MAKAQAKKKPSSLKWLVIGAGAVIVYLVAFPAQDAKSTATTKSTTKKKASTEQKYTAEDFKRAEHPYEPLKVAVVNAFKPVVFRPAGAAEKGMASFGANGWTYSGMAVVDGKRQGMLENGSTGETVMLEKSDTWMGVKVAGVNDDHINFVGPDGPITVHVEEAKEPSANSSSSSASTALPAPMAPMPVPMAGPIDTAGQDLSIMQDNTGTGRGNGRRRRRNAG